MPFESIAKAIEPRHLPDINMGAIFNIDSPKSAAISASQGGEPLSNARASDLARLDAAAWATSSLMGVDSVLHPVGGQSLRFDQSL